MLDVNATYYRKNSIVYDINDNPVLKLKQKFIDLDKLSVMAIEYMNRYCEMFPEFLEQTHQYSLFN